MTAEQPTPATEKDGPTDANTDTWQYASNRTTVSFNTAELAGRLDATPGEVILEDAPDGRVALIARHGDSPGTAADESTVDTYVELSPSAAERFARDLLQDAADAREQIVDE